MKRMLCRLLVLLLPAMLLSGCAGTVKTESPSQSPSPVQSLAVSPAAETDESLPPSTLAAPLPQGDYALFVNVGKADAALIRVQGLYYLVDAGTEQSAPALIGALRAMGVAHLEGMYLTHTHSDHIGGAAAVAQCFHVEAIYAAQYSQDKKKGGNRITELAEELELPLQRLSPGESSGPFTVLGPLVKNDADDNDNSLVLRLSTGGVTLLMTGDMQFDEEQTLLDGGADLSCDVLKVGNHGNPDATGEAFARAASPRIAVVSTDTAQDEDSDNLRVHAALSGAGMYSTEGASIGVLVELDGDLTVSFPTRPASAAPLTLSPADPETQSIAVENPASRDVDASGYMLLSQKGGQLYCFPQGTILRGGSVSTVACEGYDGDLIWEGETEAWHRKKSDPALLYDLWGNLLGEAG